MNPITARYLLAVLAILFFGTVAYFYETAPRTYPPREPERVSRGQTRIEVLLRAEAFDDDRAKPTCAILEPGVVVEIEGLRETEGGKFLLVNVLNTRRDSMVMPDSGVCRGWTREDYVKRLLN